VTLRGLSLDELTIEDEASFAHVALYGRLKQALAASTHVFRVPERGTTLSWDRALFLNLAFWSSEEGADVLCEPSLPADVVAHVAWHHLASAQLSRIAPGKPCAEALLFGEAIASAFDVYLVGRVLRNVPDAEFVASQVPRMSEAAQSAGLEDADFEALLQAVVDDPERAFEDLRALLFDATCALLSCHDVVSAEATLARFDGHRFAALLHHFELPTWLLYARAYGANAPEQAQAVHALDAELRAAKVSLDWLTERWL
jgi:hypothetical protein